MGPGAAAAPTQNAGVPWFRPPPGLTGTGDDAASTTNSFAELGPVSPFSSPEAGPHLPPPALAGFGMEAGAAPAQNAGPLWFGSYGHPHVCNRPCVYLKKAPGGCPAGAACGYCHLPHTQSTAKPDKATRRAMERMTDQELLAASLPCLRRQAAAIRNPLADNVVELLEAEMMDPPVGRVDGRVRQVMARMSFYQLVSSSMQVIPDQVKQALVDLRLQLPPPEVANLTSQRSVFL
ncbi:dus [Symbiodinium natans]|uniref:Dus protein n=1 Tax=Symbiodinium natans TaxID=878477 RepID=A0A812P5L5_9DINO|nr:dus [Symbiodinium natans]